MCNQALTWAFKQKLPGPLKFVLVALAEMAGRDGQCYPSQTLLAERCGTTRANICRRIRELVARGLIRAQSLGVGKVSAYTVACDCQPHDDPVPEQHTNTQTCAGATTEPVLEQHTEPVLEQHTEPLVSKLDSEAKASGAATAPPRPPDGVKDLWDRGIAILGSKNRALMGRMIKDYGKPVVLAAIVETERENPLDPVSYLFACCKQGRDHGAEESAYDILTRAALDFDRRRSYRDHSEAVA